MTSVLNVDTIAAKDGTSPVALTKQAAAHTHAGLNMSSGTILTTSGTTLTSQSLNVSTATDISSGAASLNITNSVSNLQFTFLGANIDENNTTCLNDTSTTTSKIVIDVRDGDSNTAISGYPFVTVIGDLA